MFESVVHGSWVASGSEQSNVSYFGGEGSPFEVEVLARPRLEARLLDSVSRKRLTLMIAPAGSGKTMALARVFERSEEAGYRPVWFDGEATHRDTGRFLGKLQQLLGGPASSSGKGQAPSIDEVHDLLRRCGQPVLLLIDNFHLCETPQVDEALVELIELAGAHLRVVLSSRVTPALKVSRLRMRSSLGEFFRKDLAVEPEEVARFVGVPEDRLDADQRRAILEYSDGWPAAIQFVRMNAVDNGGCDDIAASLAEVDENICHYIEEEIFELLSPELQEFLLSVADLERICVDLGCVVSQREDAGVAFKELIARELFVIPLDRAHNWIRFHPIFRGYLTKRLQQTRKSDRQKKLMLAANWHWRRENWREAVSHVIDAGEPELAEQWLRACSEHVIVDLGEVPAFRATCERLVETHQLSFDLIVWMVWAAALSTSWVDASRLLLRHAKTIESAEGLSPRVLLVRSLITFFAHDFEKTIEQGRAWWEGDIDGTPFDRATVASMLAVSYKTQLKLDKAKFWRDRAQFEIARSTSSYGNVWVHVTSAFLSMVEGHPLEACREIEDALAQPGLPQNARGNIEPLLAAIYYELNQTDSSRAVVDRLMLAVDGCGSLEIAFPVYVVTVLLEAKRGGTKQALTLLDDWSGRLQRRFGQRCVIMCQILKRDILSRLPNDQRMELRSCFNVAVDVAGGPSLSPDLIEWLQIVNARELLSEGRAREALEAVKGLILAANNDDRLTSWIHATLIKAVAQRTLGETKRAERILIECLGRAAPLGIRRLILDQALMLRPFGSFLQKFEVSAQTGEPGLRELVGLLLVEMDISSNVSSCETGGSPVEVLTKREARILGLIAEGLSNAQICDRLILSESTVKWHIYNIFQKFGVHSRTAAVREGRTFGFIE